MHDQVLTDEGPHHLRSHLNAWVSQYADEFARARPFPFVVIPDFFPDDVARAIGASFPAIEQPVWDLNGPGDVRHSGDKNIEKVSCSFEEFYPPIIRSAIHGLNSGIFIRFLEDLTGFKNLSPDPYFFGGGLHSTGRGGRLMIHADASRHPNPKLEQVINMIYYVTPEWREEWGGHLELWDSDCKACVQRIAPSFNSAVIFYTGTNCYHGHPQPLATPPGVRRNSIALYYYTTDRVHDESYAGYRNYVDWKHVTEHDQDRSAVHVAKGLIRRYAPAAATNATAKLYRTIRDRLR